MTKRIFRSILLVSAAVLLVGISCMVGIMYRYFDQQLEKELQNELTYLSIAAESDGVSALEHLPQDAERVTLIAADGTVLFDNRADIDTMDNHAGREEIEQALKSGSGKAIRRSDTLGEQTVYLAQRLSDGSVLRASSTRYTVLTVLLNFLYPLLGIAVLMLVLSGVFASRAAKKIVAPLNELDLDHPEANESYDELTPLLTKISRQQKTIRNQLADAKQQQEEFLLIMRHMNEGLLIIDAKTELLSGNPSAYRLLGAESDQPVKTVLELNRTEPFCRVVESALDGHRDETLLELEGGICQIVANPVMHDGKVQGAVLLLIDVTEKTQRETLRQEFTANVSHELKTPLTSISGFAELLRDGLVKPEDAQKFAGKIFDETQRLITLVNDVIKISQLDEGKVLYEKEEADLYRMAQEVLGRLQPQADKEEVALELTGAPLTLTTVRPILEEILYNLCDNAVKYNKKGGKVTVSVAQTGEKAVVSVADTGIGIPLSEQQRVFERFYRVDKSHSKEIGGTGLGLSIVKHGAAYLGAEVRVESTLGAGTTFTLSLPQEK